MPARLKLIDLFAGCGGMTRGFVDTGLFDPVFAVESDLDAAETYAANFGSHVEQRPIQQVHDFPPADVVVGGPPCQGFSTLNRHGAGYHRRGLWTHYLRALIESGARAFVMENVPQLLQSAEYEDFRTLAQAAGFSVRSQVILAADFGVPQMRRRAIVIGSRDGEPVFPTPTHGRIADPSVGTRAWNTFADAVRGAVTLGDRLLPDVPDGVAWHRPRNPRAISLERYRAIPNEGEGRFELAARRPDITPRCWLDKPTGTTDVFGRLWWGRPASTIRTEFYKPEKGRYLHPSEDRAITVREAARIMSMPDGFRLLEHQTLTSVGRQVGNAVPCLMAQRIAEQVALGLAATDPVQSEGESERCETVAHSVGVHA